MTNEQKFKKNLEDLLAAKDFSFDEANWDKARDLIDASKAKRRRVVPFFILGLILVLGLGTGTYLLSDGSSSKDQALSETKTNLLPQEELRALSPETIAKPTLQETLPNSSLKTPEAKNSPSPAKEPTRISEVNPGEKIKEPTVIKPAVKESSVKVNTNPEVQAAKDLPIVTAASSLKEKKRISSVQKKKPSDSHNTAPLTKTTTFPVAQSTPEGTESDKQTNATPDVTANENLTGKNQDLEKRSDKKPEDEIKSATVIPSQDKKEEAPETVSVAEIKTAAAQTHEELPVIAQTPTSIPDTTKAAQRDSVITKPADNADGELGKTKERPVLLSLEAGGNYMFGWKNPSGSDANGFDPVFGINYFSNFKPKMALTVGLQYTSVSNLSYSNYTSRVVRLALGEESQVSVFTPTKLHYLIMPLRFEYSLNPKNALGIGCNLAYLLTVQSTVETYREKMGTKYDVTTSKEKGYTKGFKPYDTQVSLFYKRTLVPHFAVNIEFYYGLTDIKDNTFFNTNVMERNTGVKLTLVYNFLKK